MRAETERSPRAVRAVTDGSASKAKMRKMVKTIRREHGRHRRRREIMSRADAKEAEVMAESKKCCKVSDRNQSVTAQTPSRQQEGSSANKPLAEWLQVTRVSGPFRTRRKGISPWPNHGTNVFSSSTTTKKIRQTWGDVTAGGLRFDRHMEWA